MGSRRAILHCLMKRNKISESAFWNNSISSGQATGSSPMHSSLIYLFLAEKILLSMDAMFLSKWSRVLESHKVNKSIGLRRPLHCVVFLFHFTSFTFGKVENQRKGVVLSTYAKDSVLLFDYLNHKVIRSPHMKVSKTDLWSKKTSLEG